MKNRPIFIDHLSLYKQYECGALYFGILNRLIVCSHSIYKSFNG